MRPSMGLMAAGVVLALLVTLNTLRLPWARLSAALVALLGGYVLCAAVGGVQAPAGGAWFAVPHPLKYGLSFDARFILPFGFVYLVTAIETLGDLTACSELSGEPTSGPRYWRRVRGGRVRRRGQLRARRRAQLLSRARPSRRTTASSR